MSALTQLVVSHGPRSQAGTEGVCLIHGELRVSEGAFELWIQITAAAVALMFTTVVRSVDTKFGALLLASFAFMSHLIVATTGLILHQQPQRLPVK